MDEPLGWRVEVGTAEDGPPYPREPIAEVHVLIFDWAPQQSEIRVRASAVPEGWQRRTIDHAIEELQIAREHHDK